MEVAKNQEPGSHPYLASDAVPYRDIQKRAREGYLEVRNLSIDQRIECLRRFKTYVLDHRNKIVEMIQSETKKCRTDAFIGEIFAVCDHLDYLIKNAQKFLADKHVPTSILLFGKKSRIYMEPLGTILIISPWNYPFYQAIVPITSAFITGNSVIYKPSEFTPLEGLIEDACYYAFQKHNHWCQVIYGDGQVGKELIDLNPQKIFFTGSVATGKKIMHQAAQYLIPVELELGGKDPMIIFKDANLQRAVKGAIWGSLTNTGQSCTSTERLYIERSVYQEVKELLVQEANRVEQSIDQHGDAEIGQMTTENQIQIVKEQLKDALNKGAIQLTGQNWDGTSSKIPPIILENIQDNMILTKEETFGPILPIRSFESTDEAIELANQTEFGLSASVWTEDKEKADFVARSIETGGVSINNVMLTEGNHALPFGGVKKSGIGRYKGEFGLYSFCNFKAILKDGGHKNIDPNWYPYTPEKYKLLEKMTLTYFRGGFFNFLKFVFAGLKLEKLSNTLGKKYFK